MSYNNYMKLNFKESQKLMKMLSLLAALEVIDMDTFIQSYLNISDMTVIEENIDYLELLLKTVDHLYSPGE